MSFVYLMHDKSSGWMKLGYSDTPYARVHNVRKGYAELRHADLVGCIRTDYPEQLECWLYWFVQQWMNDLGGKMCGERFSCDDAFDATRFLHIALTAAYRKVEPEDSTATAWSCLPPWPAEPKAPPIHRQRMPKKRRPYVEQRLREIANWAAA